MRKLIIKKVQGLSEVTQWASGNQDSAAFGLIPAVSLEEFTFPNL